TNRPFHVCMYFIQRYRSLKKRLWNNRRLSGWKSISDFFERIEFQNRGAAHLHIVLWTEATIEEMIASNEIRSTITNPESNRESNAKPIKKKKKTITFNSTKKNCEHSLNKAKFTST